MNAIVTLCVGDVMEPIAKLSHPTIKAYADKIGADFIVLDEKKISESVIQYEKFQIFKLLTQYDRIIYLDTDMIIRPDCPDLFEEVPEDQIGVFNEGRFTDTMELIRDTCIKYQISIPKWDRQYYNTGTMVVSRLHRHLFKKPDKEFELYNCGDNRAVAHYEQPYLNVKIITEGYKVHELNHKFNRLSIMDSITGENRLSSYIIHYAGAPRAVIPNIMSQDLEAWQQLGPDYKIPKNLHVSVGGGIGDQVDAEPVIRYMCEKIYPGDNIQVVTHFPSLFKHLPIEVLTHDQLFQKRRKDPTIYKSFETLPGPESSLWQYIAQSLCHTTDFASISVLRRILPDIDKQIKLDINPQALDSVKEILGDINPQEMVLVHPGKGWASKTFPDEWWQGIIDGLAENSVPSAVIGKYISKEQGMVELNCPDGVIDLKNLLSLEELVALVSLAGILVSNDSAPIHIAGAFDNWIVLIPTCKDPDHVLPYRNGFKTYKSKALYKKLTCDAIDSSPTQVDGQTIDYVIGEIMDYLPDVSDVVNSVIEIRNNEIRNNEIRNNLEIIPDTCCQTFRV